MATPSPAAETTLQIKRTFQAPREKVFRAWTEPEEMKHWCAPTDEYETRADFYFWSITSHYTNSYRTTCKVYWNYSGICNTINCCRTSRCICIRDNY